MLIGLCQVPYPQGASPQPFPTVASYRALSALGIDGLRLQLDLSRAQWDDAFLFRSWITPAFDAGMNINVNFVIGQVTTFTAAFIEDAAFRIAQEFGHMVKSWSFGNEPGADAQAYEGDDGPTAERDYMRDVYKPLYIAFIRGIRRAIPDAFTGGCDADSVQVQQRFVSFATHNEDWVHPYGDVGGGHYARLRGESDDPGFLDVRTSRPMGIGEIDHQQLASAIGREKATTAFLLAHGATKEEAALQGALARLQPTPGETMTLVDLLRRVGREFRDCTRFMVNMPDHFFERGTIPGIGLTCCSFYLAEPVVSDGGRAFAAAIAEINGAVDPVKTTMPVGRKRAVRT